MLYAVIMAGGTGTRFWPLSTQKTPKQFLRLFGDRTMLQSTVDRISKLIPHEQILVITNERYIDMVQEQLPDIPSGNIFGEPVARNTAPCVALAAAFLNKRDPDAVMVVLPADHYIENPQQFHSVIETAAARARDGGLVTIGIRPERPETGYGYIKYEEDSGETVKDNEVNKVSAFTEKPDRETAERFIESGNYLWNSGMFIWKADTITEAFSKHQPEIHAQMKTLAKKEDMTADDAVETFYRNCPSISIDYGIMEHADTVFVVPGAFGWNDVGSWKAVYELRTKDIRGNVVETDKIQFQKSSNNLIHSESDKLVALVGVENLAVVETEDAILVCNMDKAQDVKQIVESLKNDNSLKKYT